LSIATLFGCFSQSWLRGNNHFRYKNICTIHICVEMKGVCVRENKRWGMRTIQTKPNSMMFNTSRQFHTAHFHA
jgi:hypothetical protein